MEKLTPPMEKLRRSGGELLRRHHPSDGKAHPSDGKAQSGGQNLRKLSLPT